MALDSTTALQLAKDAYSASTTYFDASIRKQVENDIRQFQGQHPLGSKYLSDSYRARSRLFRPKTRSAVRKHEAVAAEAFFSTRDVVSVEPQDESNDVQAAGAALMQELLQHRLTKTIPWFLTLMGAYQDAQVVGLVCSYQHWLFDKIKGKDEPAIKLRPIENIRFDPGADWMDPVSTSPYFIDMIPMYVKDVRARMQENDPKTGEKKWKQVEEAVLLQAVRGYSDSIRLTREQGRTDSKEQVNSVRAYNIVWVHKNIIEHEGKDYCFYTLGDLSLLSDPKPLEDLYHHGKRPYVIGYSIVEAHKNYPGGPVHITKDVQGEINELANARIDNLKLTLNKRYLVARGRQVDLRSLTRNIAGSVTLVNDIEKDVKELAFSDVTSASYKEQENLNLDFDEAAGNFSQSSVQSNRRVGETVGGLQLLSTDANQVSGYQLRTFVETWVEPVLRQLILLEQHYETDETILGIAGQRANLFEKFGIDAGLDDLLAQELTLSVSVGMGATNPQEKVNRFLKAMQSLNAILTDSALVQAGLKVKEVVKEVFGNLGYRDGSRFFDDKTDPRIQQLMGMIQDLQQQLSQKEPPEIIEAKVREINANVELLQSKVKSTDAQAVKTGVDASYSAMQAAEVVTAVPQVTSAADVIMQAAGYRSPTPAGVSPVFEQGLQGAGGAITVQPVENHKTGLGITPGGVPAAGQPGGPAPGDTTPNNTPAQPATPGTGAAHGIETMRADGVRGMANGGLIGVGEPGFFDMEAARNLQPGMRSPEQQAAIDNEQKALTAENKRLYPEAYGAKAAIGPGGLVDQLLSTTIIGSESNPRHGGYASVIGYADGGVIEGPGTGTSDSIPAVTSSGQPAAVSNGEYLVKAPVVQAMGVEFFQGLIDRFHQPAEGAEPATGAAATGAA
jgi:hypothetical protein